MDNYQEIGQLLTAARRQMRLSAEDAAARLHIRVRYVQALEEGRLDAIPGLAYTRGYLQSYANFLDLDAEEILRRFEAVEEAMGKRGFYFPQVLNREKSPNSRIVWGSLSVALVMSVAWCTLAKPPGHSVSIVEPLPQPPVKLEEVACAKEQDALYPPCTMETGLKYGLLPLSRQRTTIMELARH